MRGVLAGPGGLKPHLDQHVLERPCTRHVAIQQNTVTGGQHSQNGHENQSAAHEKQTATTAAPHLYQSSLPILSPPSLLPALALSLFLYLSSSPSSILCLSLPPLPPYSSPSTLLVLRCWCCLWASTHRPRCQPSETGLATDNEISACRPLRTPVPRAFLPRHHQRRPRHAHLISWKRGGQKTR